jgi:hypothetical protein
MASARLRKAMELRRFAWGPAAFRMTSPLRKAEFLRSELAGTDQTEVRALR